MKKIISTLLLTTAFSACTKEKNLPVKQQDPNSVNAASVISNSSATESSDTSKKTRGNCFKEKSG